MRLGLTLLALCSAAITITVIVLLLTKGPRFSAALQAAPQELGEKASVQKASWVRTLQDLRWRFSNRETTRLIDQVMTVSGEVFKASPRLAGEMAHLRRTAAAGLHDDPRWVRLDAVDVMGRTPGTEGIELNPVLLELPALDAALVFWQEVQRAYDNKQVAARRKGNPLAAFIMDRPVEAEQRAWRAGCDFLAAGLRLGLAHDAARMAERDCSRELPLHYYCDAKWSAEQVEHEWKNNISIYGDSPSEVDRKRRTQDSVVYVEASLACLDLERAAKGNPLSLDGFHPQWSFSECLDRARQARSQPGWRPASRLCPPDYGSAQLAGPTLAPRR